MGKRTGMTPGRRRREKKIWRKLEKEGKRALQQEGRNNGHHTNLESSYAARRERAAG